MTTKKTTTTKLVDNTKKFDINDVGFTMTLSIGLSDILRLLAEHDSAYEGLTHMKFMVTDVFSPDNDNIDITFDTLME